MPSPPLDLEGLAAAVLEVLTTFLTVSYVASTASEGLSSAFNLRAKLLMRTIRELLNETHNSAPVTLAIYNNYLFNPRAAEPADTIAAVKVLPTIVDPLTFARALMDAVGLRGDNPQQMLDAIDAIRPDPTLARLDPTLRPLARNLVEHYSADIRGNNLNNLQKSIANWYQRAVGHRADAYRRLSQLSNFIIGLLLAALLGLSPLPKSLMESGLLGYFSAQFSSEWPLKLVGYVIVALSTLYGAPFWFALINMLNPVKPTGIDPGAAAGPPTGILPPPPGTPSPDQPPAGPATGQPAGTPSPDQPPAGPAPSGPPAGTPSPDQPPAGPAPSGPTAGTPSGPPEAPSSAPH